MSISVPGTVDWQGWLARWDRQQEGYLPEREQRFTAMLDVLAALLPGAFTAVDLACGPGAISQRLLARFPQARCIAVDLDPVLLALGQGVLGDAGGRLRWVEADLLDPAWVERLGATPVDAVLSTTALHWIPGEHLVRLYRDLGRLVRAGGVFLNGDNLAFGPELPSFQAVAKWQKDRLWAESSFAARGIETWQQWWDALAQEPALTDLLAERERRFSWRSHHADETRPGYDFHVAALRDGGFREVGTIWQNGTNRILMAVR